MLQQKKKVMMMRQAAPAPSIPYITDGLILWLDGLTVASNSLWVDQISGARFTLHNATKAMGGGVTFAGADDSYGESTATFPDGVTIEAAVTFADTTNNQGIFGQQGGNDSAIMLFRTMSSRYIMTKYSSANRSFRRTAAAPASVEIISATKTSTSTAGIAVVNGEVVSSTGNNYLAYPDGIVGSLLGWIGTRNTLNGTIHSLRIYNRALTTDEMVANQVIDNQRYGLGITFPT